MTLALQPVTGSIKIVAVGDAHRIARGRPAEFRHRGLTLAARPTAMTALLEIGRDPGSIVLVPTDLADMPLTQFIDVLRSVARVPVIAGIAAGCSTHEIAELYAHGIVGTVALPATPGRLADAVLASSRTGPQNEELLLERGHLVLDDARHRVTWYNQEVTLPPRSFELLRYLLIAYPRVVPIRELMEFVGEAGRDRANRTRVAIGRMRSAFNSAAPHYGNPIETLHRIGYRVRP